LLASSYFWSDTDVYRYFWRDLLHVALLLVILRFVIVFPHYKYFKILETKLASFIGRISYVLYLCHMAFIYLVASYIELNPAINFLLILALSVVFSWFVMLIIERPGQRIRNYILVRFV
jgi:peptidoglycan/LPS O-acetylase OafA/YrhL